MTEGYRYNERNELTERIRVGSLTTYSYDKNGSIVSEAEERGKSEYRYDLLNRQIYVRTLDGREQDNTYDGEGLRAGLKENGKSMTFLFHNGEILTECDGDSAPARRHVRGIGLFHVQTVHDNVYHAYHQDEQGSTAYITGQENEVETVYQYDAFGNLTEKKEGITNRILYTGQQYDQETGQYYLRARYYNPVVGRFLQEDTYRGDGLNLYVYCADNPVVYYDPSGHDLQYSDTGEKVPDGVPGGQAGSERGTSSIDSNKQIILDGLKEAPVEYRINPETGMMEPYMKQIQITDDYKAILRRDIGDFNHGDLDHWNLEVQTMGGNTKYDLHLYLGDDGNLLPFTEDNIYTPKKSPFN